MSEKSTDFDAEKASEEHPDLKQEPQNDEEEIQYPHGLKLLSIITALYLSMFLVALDRTIIATAIPRITDDFDSLGDVGWYGSAYLITTCAFQLMFAKFYTFYSPKSVFLFAIGVFELGSAICGAAPNSTAFIVGRAIAGLGSAGIFSGAIVIVVYTVPLHKRPIFQGLFGAVFGLASVAGPLLGGVFTQKVSWRWCFYINLPIGAATFVILVFILKISSPRNEASSLRQKFLRLDPLGTVFFLPGVVCLLLALQWGGSTYAWKDGRIIALLILFAIFITAFLVIQFWKRDTATLPPRIILQRSIAAGMWFSLCAGSAMMILVYYLPLWFQAIKGVSAVESGIRSLPMIISLVVVSILTGISVTKFGYYTPFMIASAVLMSIGAGLITTLKVDSGHPKWIGYQVVFGLGLGMGMQQSGLAAQAVLKGRDVPTGVSLMFFMQTLGGAIFVSVGQNIFSNKLASGLASVAGLNASAVVNTGATDLRSVIGAKGLGVVLIAYNNALDKTFQVALAMACFAIIGALAMEWKSIKKVKKGVPPAKEVVEAEDASTDEKTAEVEV
ncbi:MAG: hypothetical protein M1827_006234 [Pycnora praestabilis]|nr:MAG: hypothetical protein M1827_006234 [Pycnora praestabilis]